MTGTTRSIQRGSHDSARMQELLRVDAAAAIDDDLDEELLDDGGQTRVKDGVDEQSSRPRSQVYSIRVPVERLEQVRRLAKERGMAPTAMLREWVLVQLDAATGAHPHEDSTDVPVVQPTERDSREEHVALAGKLEAAVVGLAGIATQFTQALTLLTELFAAQTMPKARPVATFHSMPTPLRAASAWPHHAAALQVGQRPEWAESPWLSPFSTVFMTQPMSDHVYRGLDALALTVHNVSSQSGFENFDLDKLYLAADEELSNP